MGAHSFGGITQAGAPGNYTYAVKAGFENKPVTFASFYDSLRFINWLNNGQGNGDTETGAYTLLGGTAIPSNGASVTRNAGAVIALTSESEWYKAAYHQPASADGDSDNYWLFPTRSNTQPIAQAPPGGINSANYGALSGLTDVGAYSASPSYYGTFDQGGNVSEWNERIYNNSSTLRSIAGGDYETPGELLDANHMRALLGTGESQNIGFRIVSVPEPSVGVLVGAIAGLALARGRKRGDSYS